MIATVIIRFTLYPFDFACLHPLNSWSSTSSSIAQARHPTMFNFKRNSSGTSSPSKRPQLLPPRPSFAQGDSLSTRSGSPTHSIHSQASYGAPGSPLGSPRLFTPTPGYQNGPTSSTGYFPSIHPEPQREWTEESLGQLRKSVLEDLKKMDEVVNVFTERKEMVAKLMGLERDLAGGLRRLVGAASSGKDGTEGDMVGMSEGD